LTLQQDRYSTKIEIQKKSDLPNIELARALRRSLLAKPTDSLCDRTRQKFCCGCAAGVSREICRVLGQAPHARIIGHLCCNDRDRNALHASVNTCSQLWTELSTGKITTKRAAALWNRHKHEELPQTRQNA
jgi:hypothetical protein